MAVKKITGNRFVKTVYLDSLEIVARKGVESADLGQHAILTPGFVQMDVKTTWSPLFVQTVNLLNMALTVPWTVVIVNTVYPVQWIQENVQLVARKDGLEHTVQCPPSLYQANKQSKD